MSERPSILGNLRRGFLGIAATGFIILALFVIVDYELLSRQSDKDLAHIAHQIMDHAVLPVVVLMTPLLLTSFHMIRRSLKPLDEAAARIDSATGKDRGFRVDTRSVPAEALPFAEAINNLLGRLDETALRQEGFVADVAHELKHPLATIMLELEGMTGERANRLRADVTAMNRLIEQLLVMAQLDAYAAAPQPFSPVSLGDLATSLIATMAPAAIESGVELAYDDAGSAIVSGRAETLSAAIRNLIENAIRVTPPSSCVTVRTGPGPQLAVRDGGPGLSGEQLARLSRRYHRADHASPGGAGLGLAIVARIVQLHGGVLITAPLDRELRLVLPACPGAQPVRLLSR